MALVNFTALDFNDIRSSLREYLRANSNFTDYDFEGSNLSVIVDTLAYNTYISSYNANMITNEVFIDSATLRENVVSLARNIGYVPRSKTASKAVITFFVDTTALPRTSITLTLQKGTVCTASNTDFGSSYTFTIPDDITVPVVNGIALFENVEIYEGFQLQAIYTINANDPNQRIILDNPGIDTSLIRTYVRDTETSKVQKKYSLSNSILDVNSNSKVFFLQEIEDEKYELIFGDNVFGKKLENQNYLEIFYTVTNGADANGIKSFKYNGRIIDNNGRVVTDEISLITTVTPSYGGTNIESVGSIKKYAPRIYAAQNRAVTANDYETIIPQLYPETESISVFGGEELSPPKYGKVFITIKPINGTFVPNSIKDNLKSVLRRYSVAGIVPEILDLKYIYLEIDSTIYYNNNFVSGPEFVRNIVFENVLKYSDSSEMNKYGARFKYSKFLKIIDDSHESITSNITKVVMRRDLGVKLNQFADYEICYGNQFHVKNPNGYNIKSSGFRVVGVSGTVYISDIPNNDDRTGRIIIFKLDSNSQPLIVRKNAGIVDYEKGEIRLYPINIFQTSKFDGDQAIVQISTIPKSNDVIGLQDLYLQLDINNSVLNMASDSIASGSDISGSNYKFTSSYTNGDLVRL